MKKQINFAGVTPETWARTIILVIALINQVLATFGKGQIEITESDIYQLCSLTATIASAIWCWWKNNSFSEGAQNGDAVMHAHEAGELEYSKKAYQPETDHYAGKG